MAVPLCKEYGYEDDDGIFYTEYEDELYPVPEMAVKDKPEWG